MKHLSFRGLAVLVLLALSLGSLGVSPALAQTVGHYAETDTGTTKNAVGVTIVQGSNVANASQPTSDAQSVQTGLWVNGQLEVYNGSTWSRIATANTTNAGTGTGLLGVGNMVFNGTNWYRQAGDSGGNAAEFIAPTASAGAGIIPIASAAAESSHVLKASAGNVYNVTAVNLTATAGFVVLINATTAPADGAITPLACMPLPANSTGIINFASGSPPGYFNTGIVAVLSSGASCFTKTTGTITGFIFGQVQ